MIEINLLPPELKKAPSSVSGEGFKKIDLGSIPILKIAVGSFAILALVQVVVIVLGIVSNAQLSSLTVKYNAILPEKAEADILKAKVADINKRSSAIDGLIAKRFSWARKLNMLSDSMTPGIWLTEVYYDERSAPAGKAKKIELGSLVITGFASGAGEEGTALIGKFIKSLQDNNDFFSDMAGIDLVSTRSDKISNQEVMSFKIDCIFK